MEKKEPLPPAPVAPGTPENPKKNQDLSAAAADGAAVAGKAAAAADGAVIAGRAAAAATTAEPGFAASDTVVSNLTKSTADTLCEVALKISSAALLINRAALVMKELVNKDSSKVVLPSERSFTLSEERGSQTDAKTLHKDPSKDNC